MFCVSPWLTCCWQEKSLFTRFCHRISHNLFVFLLHRREAEMQQEKLAPKEIQRWCEDEVKQNIRPEVFDSVKGWKTGVRFNYKIFHFSRDKNVLWALSLEAINGGGEMWLNMAHGYEIDPKTSKPTGSRTGEISSPGPHRNCLSMSHVISSE